MKFCMHCGEEIEDQILICPKCGKSLRKSFFQEYSTETTSNFNSNGSSSLTIGVLTFLGGLANFALIVGVVLFIIGGAQEYLFRTENNLSGLTEAGVNLVRKCSAYSNSINFLTAGSICAGIGVLLDLFLIYYRR